MTLTLTLTLSPEAEAELRAGIASHDTERVRRVLAAALVPTVASLLQQVTSLCEDDQEWEAALDELADSFASSITEEMPVLSDYAVSRAGIYEEHP
ncbi:MAG: hypothetical protein ACR2H9_07000 [Longimicrobiaceae bacterium]